MKPSKPTLIALGLLTALAAGCATPEGDWTRGPDSA